MNESLGEVRLFYQSLITLYYNYPNMCQPYPEFSFTRKVPSVREHFLNSISTLKSSIIINISVGENSLEEFVIEQAWS